MQVEIIHIYQSKTFYVSFKTAWLFCRDLWNLKNGILIPKLLWPTVRKNWSGDLETLLKFEAEGREFAKKIEITRTIYSNRERSEHFLVTECFFNFPGGFSDLIN